MKKIVVLAISFILLIICVIVFTNKERTYVLDYDKDGYKVVERYDGNYFTFNISKDNINVDFAYEHKYTTKRKLVEEINCYEEESGYTLCKLKVFNETKMVQIKDDKLYSILYENDEVKNDANIKKVDNITLNDDSSTILIWTSYGFKDIIHNKEYNFIDKEQYDNPLTYQLGNYLLIPDYNQSKSFNVFYIIDVKNQKINKWKLKYNISFDSYFLGDKDNLIYLFDKENEKEYTLNIDKKQMKKISNSNGGIAFEGREINYSLSDLKYKNITFKNNNIFNYYIRDNKLYYNYYGSTKEINVIKNLDVKKIISLDNKGNAFVLSGDSIYYVENSGNYRKIASYFEWNFSADNKVFIFNN